MQINHLLNWFAQDISPNYVLGYGSLLSESSRRCHSNIICPSLFVTVCGFQRSWVTRSKQENQTYLGAQTMLGSALNVQLIPVQFDASFIKREQDYEFVQVALNAIFLPNISDTEKLRQLLIHKKVWICKTLSTDFATDQYPVTASYVATCIMGCLAGNTCDLENGYSHDYDFEQAAQFVATTEHWPKTLHNDLNNPLYPRHADFSHPLFKQTKRVMFEQGMISD